MGTRYGQRCEDAVVSYPALRFVSTPNQDTDHGHLLPLSLLPLVVSLDWLRKGKVGETQGSAQSGRQPQGLGKTIVLLPEWSSPLPSLAYDPACRRPTSATEAPFSYSQTELWLSPVCNHSLLVVMIAAIFRVPC